MQLFRLSELPMRLFTYVVKDHRSDVGKHEVADALQRGRFKDLKRSNSRLPHLLQAAIEGYYFSNNNAAWIKGGHQTVSGTSATIMHEMNHAANRIPAKKRTGENKLYTKRWSIEAFLKIHWLPG